MPDWSELSQFNGSIIQVAGMPSEQLLKDNLEMHSSHKSIRFCVLCSNPPKFCACFLNFTYCSWKLNQTWCFSIFHSPATPASPSPSCLVLVTGLIGLHCHLDLQFMKPLHRWRWTRKAQMSGLFGIEVIHGDHRLLHQLACTRGWSTFFLVMVVCCRHCPTFIQDKGTST